MTQTTATATRITYRKTRTGEWVAFGPADQIAAGREVTVSKRDGSTKTELVASTGKTFQVDGQAMRYGYLDRETGREIAAGRREDATLRRQDRAARPSRRNNWQTRPCQDCQDIEDMSDAMGCARHRGNPRN